ncbi:MAG: hypothetical protein ACJ77A_12545 [Actinomycetota bacterium]
MNGELAQVICLAGYGTAWLAGRLGPEPPPVEAANATFRYVGRLGFSLDGDPSGESDAVAGWMRGLQARGVDRLWLVTGGPEPGTTGRAPFEERYLVAFAGAGSWSILATGGRTAEAWRASWNVADIQAPDQRIWDVRYRGASLEEAEEPPRPSPVEATRDLRESLGAARQFAVSHDLAEWGEVFGAAFEGRAAAEDPDMLPAAAFPAESRSLAATASRAWVFGGMGTWNDLSFGDPEVRGSYEQISEALYRSVLAALVAATNTDLGPAP